MGYLVLVAFLLLIVYFNRNRSVRLKIRRVIKKHPNTVRYLKNGTFQRHELLTSLKGKVIDELSGQKLRIDRNKLDQLIEKEIMHILQGWKRKVVVFLRAIGGTAVVILVGLYIIGSNLPDSKEPAKDAAAKSPKDNTAQVDGLLTSAQTHIQNNAWDQAKTDLETALKLNPSSADAQKLLVQVDGKLAEEQKNKKAAETALKDENYFNSGISFFNSNENEKALSQFKKVSKGSSHYQEAQDYIVVIENKLLLAQYKNVSYQELKKSPDEFKGHKIHFYGRIFNIQEVSGKTILSLATGIFDREYTGDDVFILFPDKTPFVEGDYIDIYGKMVGNYTKSQNFISHYLDDRAYSIYYDSGTFYEQAPVIETKFIDQNGMIYRKQ